MITAKDFWNTVCVELDYRFFSGVATPGLLTLYKNMSPNMMHYVPAANERIALGLVSGAYLSGFKGGLLLDGQFISDINRSLEFNMSHKIPLIIISFGDQEIALKIPKIKLSSLNDIVKLDEMYDKKLNPIQLMINEGVIYGS